jgi:hypothetical protein
MQGVDGVSLAPLLRGESLPPLKLYAETGFTHASPDAFESRHRAGAPRTFDAYRVRPDGIIEMGNAAHVALLAEKDHGAFDGRSWWTVSPQKDGQLLRHCRGPCDDPSLGSWLDEQLARKEQAR